MIRPGSRGFRLRLLPLVLVIGAVGLGSTPAGAATHVGGAIAIADATSSTLPCPHTPGVGTPYPSTISVSGEGTSLTDVNATVTLTHTFPDDVDLLLVGPSGASVVLMADSGFLFDVTGLSLTFDDAASSSLPDLTALSSGTFDPTRGTGTFGVDGCGMPASFPGPAPAGPYGTTMSVFNGSNPNGTWSLYAIDDTLVDTGSISSWSLDITAPAAPAPSPTLTVLRAGTGSGSVTSNPAGISCPPDCTAGSVSGISTASYGDTYVLTAHPAPGSVFTRWTGACTGTGPTCGVSLTSNETTVGAWFDLEGGTSPPPSPSPEPPPTPENFQLSVSKVGKGRVVSTPEAINCGRSCTGTFQEGTSITLTATPKSGWVLKRWRLGCSGSAPTCTLDMSSNRRAEAVFERALAVSAKSELK